VVQIADSAESVKETGLSQRAVELRLRAAFCRAFSANALFYDPLRAGDLPFAKVLQRLPPNRPRKRGSAPGVATPFASIRVHSWSVFYPRSSAVCFRRAFTDNEFRA
jgi:hypothetical protein